MIKIIYAEKRKPGLSREGFARSWRSHAGDAMKCPDFWDPILFYAQNDAVPNPPALRWLDPSYDAVGEVWYRTRADCDATLSGPSLGPITEDGDHIFARVDTMSMVADYTTIVDRRLAAVRLFAFIDRPEQPEALAAAIAELASADNVFAQHVRQAGMGLAVAHATGCAAVLEFAYDTVAEAALAHSLLIESVSLEALRPTLILAHSYLLYDKRNHETHG